MPKAEPLGFDALSTPQHTPKAATPARSPAMPKAAPAKVTKPAPPAEPVVPLQIRIPKQDARAIKIAAAERDQTISEFMLACFHAYMKSGSKA